jgi:hypothetical protein
LLARNNEIDGLLQYEVTVEIENRHGGDPITHKTIFYGRLEKILVCKLPNDNIFWDLGGTTCILALIIPCNTNGCDATIEMTTYTTTAASIITDLRSIKAVVGLIESLARWTIIDRSRSLAHVAFANEGAAEDDDTDDSEWLY